MTLAMEECAALLGFTLPRLSAGVHHAAVNAARKSSTLYPGTCPAAWLLPGLPGLPTRLHTEVKITSRRQDPAEPPPSARQESPKPAITEPALAKPAPADLPEVTTTPEPRPSDAHHPALLQPYLKALEQARTKDINAHDIIDLGMRTLYEGMAYERVSFCLLNKARDALHVRFCQTLADIPQLQTMVLDLHQSNLLRALMLKPQCVYIDINQRDKYLPMLPAALRRKLLPGEMALMSITINDKPLGLLLGEIKSMETLHKRVFKHVGQLISKSLSSDRSQ